MNDYYVTLGIRRDASPAEIKTAYKNLAVQHHPDHNPGSPDATETFRRINEAFEVLSNPEKRAVYDQTLPENRIAKIAQGGSAIDAERRAPYTAPKEDYASPAPAFGGTRQSVAQKIDVTVEGLLKTEGPEDLRKTLILRAILGSHDKEGLLKVAGNNNTRLGTPGIRAEVGIAAGERYAVLENDAVELSDVAHNGKYNVAVMTAAGIRLAEVAEAKHMNLLEAFSGSSATFTPYCSSTCAGSTRFDYSNKDDPRKPARIAAGLKLVSLETFMPHLLEIMSLKGHPNGHYPEVRTAAGMKLVGMEESELGLMRIWTDAKDLPEVQKAVTDKINIRTNSDKGLGLSAGQRAQKAAMPAAQTDRKLPPPLPAGVPGKPKPR
jgi:hypothetical protein